MTQPFLGEIRIFAGNFAPRGNALCSGQLLAISQNTALFSLLGTQFGGNGTSTFGLPDLQGRAPLSQGNGPGLSPYVMGESTGTESVTLTQQQLPVHTHPLQSRSSRADRSNANSAMLAQASDGVYAAAGPNTQLNPLSVSPGGGGNQPHNNMQPYLAMSFIIALQGIFPARN
ncbi:MAG: tail fiber protein [Rudaea sp.]|nr:tail fiber protein [Rudaea sp.]